MLLEVIEVTSMRTSAAHKHIKTSVARTRTHTHTRLHARTHTHIHRQSQINRLWHIHGHGHRHTTHSTTHSTQHTIHNTHRPVPRAGNARPCGIASVSNCRLHIISCVAVSNGAIPKLNFLVSARISVVMSTFSVFWHGILAFWRALRQRIFRGRGSKPDIWTSSAQRKTVW